MAGRTPRELAREFAAARSLKPNLGRAIAHHSLSVAPGINLSDVQWQMAAAAYLKEMGYGENYQYTIIKHTDEEHEHVHIISCRIGLADGSVVSDANDRKRCHKAAAKAALSVGLTPVPPPDKTKPRVRVSRDEAEHAQRMGVIHPKLTVAARLDVALEHSCNFEQFKQNTAKLGIEVREASNTGGVYGVSYALTNPPAGFRATAWKGSTIGPGYSFKHIERRLAGEGLDQIVNDQTKQFKTILDFTRAEAGKNGKTVRRWEKGGSIAAIYSDTAISFRSENEASIRLTAQIAAEMGWKEVHIGGSLERQKLAAVEYQKLGIRVVNAPEMEVGANAKPYQSATAASEIRSSGLDDADSPTPKATADSSAEIGQHQAEIETQAEAEERDSHLAGVDPLPDDTSSPETETTAKSGTQTGQHERAETETQANTERQDSHMAEIDPLEFLKAPEIATANAAAQDVAEADSNAASKAAAEKEAAEYEREHNRLANAFLVDREFWNSMFESGGADQIDQRAQVEAQRRAAALLADESAAAVAKRAQLLKELEREEKEKKLRAEKAAKAQEKRDKERAADPLRPNSKPKG